MRRPFTTGELDRLPVPYCVARSFMDAVLRATNVFQLATGPLVNEPEYRDRTPCRCEDERFGP